MRQTRILIVGAGLAGLATARALARGGFSAEVIERRPGWHEAGTGIYLPANATRALRALGLEQAVSERAAVISRQLVSDDRGRLLVEVDLAELWDGIGPCLALERVDLHAVLLDGARDVPLRLGAEIRGLREQGGRVLVAFGDDAAARPVGQVGWRFLTACPAQITTWSVMLGHRTAFLMVPIGNGRVYCYGDVVSAAGDEHHEDLGRLFSGYAEPVPELLGSIPEGDPVHRSTIEEVALDAWVRGRVVLVGDAAHATSPNMAEGAAMALEDALVLAACLKRHAEMPAALSDFEARRHPRTDWVRAQTRRRDRTRHLPTVVRNVVLRAFGRTIFRSNYRPLRQEAL